MAEPRRRATGFESAKGARVLVVEARFYDDVADALWMGAKRVLDAASASIDRISVPGALEIPQALAFVLDAARQNDRPYDGAVALGCVIRGETSHYDVVAGESARALLDIAVSRGTPIGNGILTVDTEAQAFARASHNQRDKGGDAARATLALIALKREATARS
ncbi:MAG TPA: 6,7-dimethyl-8-ribityllumazine synthase [Xanthobacteraceae bacterium]|nr:6,7-dimethyl-8-ribityllumazine synthase [Xanthobacteraceae bacterium]